MAVTSEQKSAMLDCLFRARAEIDTVNVILHGGFPPYPPASFDGCERCDMALLNAARELLAAQEIVGRAITGEGALERERTSLIGKVIKEPTAESLALADEAIKQHLTKE